MKTLLVFMGIVALIVIYFLIDTHITAQMWVYTGGDEWHIVAEGWEILLHAWLVALGLVFGGIAVGFFVFGGWLWLWADREDLKKARTRADTAETRAQAAIAKERADIKYREKQVDEALAMYRNKVELAHIKTREAEKIAEDAEKRRVNAVATAHRRKDKIDELKEELKAK